MLLSLLAAANLRPVGRSASNHRRPSGHLASQKPPPPCPRPDDRVSHRHVAHPPSWLQPTCSYCSWRPTIVTVVARTRSLTDPGGEKHPHGTVEGAKESSDAMVRYSDSSLGYHGVGTKFPPAPVRSTHPTKVSPANPLPQPHPLDTRQYEGGGGVFGSPPRLRGLRELRGLGLGGGSGPPSHLPLSTPRRLPPNPSRRASPPSPHGRPTGP